MDKKSVETRLTIVPEIQGTGIWEGSTLVYEPQSAWPRGQSVTINLEAGARSVAFLPLLSRQSWSFTVSNPDLIFLSPAEGVVNIHLYTPDSEEVNSLTQSQGGVMDYSLSADRSKLVYDHAVQRDQTEIRTLDLVSGEDSLLYSCPQNHSCRQAALSPSMNYLAFVQYPHSGNEGGDLLFDRGQVRILQLAGDGDTFMVSAVDHDSHTPLWSSKDMLAFYDETSLSIEILQPSAQSVFEVVRSVPNDLELLGSWSPDGRYLAFSALIFPESRPLNTQNFNEDISPFYSHIYRLDVLSGEVIDLTGLKIGLVEDAMPLFSPDGQWIAFSRKYLDEERWDLGRQLWLMDANGFSQEVLSDASIYAHTNFDWDPDSKTLVSMRVNQSKPSESAEIWVFDVFSGDTQRVVESGFMPHWVP